MSNAESDPGTLVKGDEPPTPMAVIKAAHRGERSLGETYWLWLVIPTTIQRIAMWALNRNMLSLYIDHPYLYYVLIFGLQFFFLGWLYYFGIGLFRSAGRAQSRFWAGLACIMVGISFVVSPVTVGMSIFQAFGIGYGASSLRSQVVALNAQLPRRIDSATTFLHVDYSDDRIVFQYRVDPPLSAVSNWNNIDRKLMHDTCGTYEGQFELDELKSVNFHYTLSSGELVHEAVLNRKTCSRENLAKVGPPLSGAKLLEEEYANANRALPKRLDDITTLTHVRLDGGLLYFDLRLDTNQVDMSAVRTSIRIKACAEYKDHFAKGEFSAVKYRYSFPNDPEPQVITLEKSDCPPS